MEYIFLVRSITINSFFKPPNFLNFNSWGSPPVIHPNKIGQWWKEIEIEVEVTILLEICSLTDRSYHIYKNWLSLLLIKIYTIPVLSLTIFATIKMFPINFKQGTQGSVASTCVSENSYNVVRVLVDKRALLNEVWNYETLRHPMYVISSELWNLLKAVRCTNFWLFRWCSTISIDSSYSATTTNDVSAAGEDSLFVYVNKRCEQTFDVYKFLFQSVYLSRGAIRRNNKQITESISKNFLNISSIFRQIAIVIDLDCKHLHQKKILLSVIK